METKPAAVAAHKASKKCFRFSIGVCSGGEAETGPERLLSGTITTYNSALPVEEGPRSRDPELRKRLEGGCFATFVVTEESGIGFIRCFGGFLVLRHPLTPVTTQLHVYAVLQSLSSSGIKETAMWAWLDICGSGFALYCVLWIGTFLIIPPIYILLMHHKTHYKENMKTTLCSFLLKLYLHCKY